METLLQPLQGHKFLKIEVDQGTVLLIYVAIILEASQIFLLDNRMSLEARILSQQLMFFKTTKNTGILFLFYPQNCCVQRDSSGTCCYPQIKKNNNKATFDPLPPAPKGSKRVHTVVQIKWYQKVMMMEMLPAQPICFSAFHFHKNMGKLWQTGEENPVMCLAQ